MRRIATLLFLLGLASGCAEPPEDTMRIAGPVQRMPGREVSLRILEDGHHVDLDLARRRLALYLDSPSGSALFAEKKLLLDELPAPRACRWVRVADDVTTISCVVTPLGRLALCRLDDGGDVTLEDFEEVLLEEAAGVFALRLVVRPERRNAVRELTGRAADSSLLFVVDGTVLLAAAVDGPLEEDMLLVGLSEEPARRFLTRG